MLKIFEDCCIDWKVEQHRKETYMLQYHHKRKPLYPYIASHRAGKQ